MTNNLSRIWTAPPHHEIPTGGPKAPEQYARQRRIPVPVNTVVEAFDTNAKAQYRLVQVSGSDSVKLVFANVATTASDGLVLNAGDAYEMARVYGNLFTGRIFAIAITTATEITILELGEA